MPKHPQYHNNNNEKKSASSQNSENASDSKRKTKILVLQGNRQTGELLLGRMNKLTRKLRETHEFVAPDAPFPCPIFDEDDASQLMKTWWNRDGDVYHGLEDSVELIRSVWEENCSSKKDGGFEGMIGFSQGARLIQLLCQLQHRGAMIHNGKKGQLFPGLKYVIIAGGYDSPLPPNLSSLMAGNCGDNDKIRSTLCDIPSLHVMGSKDEMIPPSRSREVLAYFTNPVVHEHSGGHCLPMKAADVSKMISFITENSVDDNNAGSDNDKAISMELPRSQKVPLPDEAHEQDQIDEVEALKAIYPDQIHMRSNVQCNPDDEEGSNRYAHPITYDINLSPETEELWPPHELRLSIKYPPLYPDVSPIVSLGHSMNVFEFPSVVEQSCLEAIRSSAQDEMGMPCVMGCVMAALDFFESGGMSSLLQEHQNKSLQSTTNVLSDEAIQEEDVKNNGEDGGGSTILGLSSTSRRVIDCDLEGQAIATAFLTNQSSATTLERSVDDIQSVATVGANVKGGVFSYTIGLVGKPSAGKSTFFNAATAFARQANPSLSTGKAASATADIDTSLGASMAPHPFTTIDPNVGYALFPAPKGSCPEDDYDAADNKLIGGTIGSNHGRDGNGRRMIAVTLKDVAGLVPGAYKGRGRGNKFLDDLTDADVLIHVVDASGTADTEGNQVVTGYNNLEEDDDDTGGTTDPMNDLEWVRGELLEWVTFNLSVKWNQISKKGRDKLISMFSGYKQPQSFVHDVLHHVEQFLQNQSQNNHETNTSTIITMDNLNQWDGGDLRRLVSAFLGARFPMTLALNKSDFPSAKHHIKTIKNALPIHGARAGVALSAREEMNFVRRFVVAEGSSESCRANDVTGSKNHHQNQGIDAARPPENVWKCLQAAMSMREPILVFPVFDMSTYDPLPGMWNYATRDASLPNERMIACFEATGGVGPTLWDDKRKIYFPNITASANKVGSVTSTSRLRQPLRDTLLMKPGSTVEHVYLALKHLGALSGDYVRAEGACNIGQKSRLVAKSERLGKDNRILKIMTNKRTILQ